MASKVEPLSAKQLAIKLGTDARTVRKFLRATRGQVGQGKRWAIEGTKKELAQMQKQFDEWKAESTRPAKANEDPESTDPLDGDEPIDDPDFTDLTDLEEIEDLDLEDD